MEFLRCFGLKSLEELPPLPEKETPMELEIEKPTDVIEEYVKNSETEE